MSVCGKLIFKRVFEEWNTSLQRFLVSRGLSLDDAGDLVQDCFVRLWNNCEKVKVEQAGSYLFTLARNISIDHFRKEKTKLKYKNQLRSENEIKDGQYMLEMAEFKEKLENAIDTMPELSKEVFVMHRFDSLSYKEIANVLNISTKAIEKRMHKALKHLSEQKIIKKK